MDATSNEDDNFVAWLARRKARKEAEKGKAEDGGLYEVTDEAKGGDQLSNGANKNKGPRSRRHWRDSEYHLHLKCP